MFRSKKYTLWAQIDLQDEREDVHVQVSEPFALFTTPVKQWAFKVLEGLCKESVMDLEPGRLGSQPFYEEFFHLVDKRRDGAGASEENCVYAITQALREMGYVVMAHKSPKNPSIWRCTACDWEGDWESATVVLDENEGLILRCPRCGGSENMREVPS